MIFDPYRKEFHCTSTWGGVGSWGSNILAHLLQVLTSEENAVSCAFFKNSSVVISELNKELDE